MLKQCENYVFIFFNEKLFARLIYYLFLSNGEDSDLILCRGDLVVG